MNTFHTNIAGGIVIGPNKKVIVVNQNGNSWSLPKGHIEPGENEKTAAVREIIEESGVTNLKLLKKLGQYKRYKTALRGGDDTSELKTISMFLFLTEQTRLKPIDPHNPEARWVDVDDVSSLLTHPKDKIFFESIKPELLRYTR